MEAVERRRCCVEGCNNLAGYRGMRRGRRRYRRVCEKHRGRVRVRKKRLRPKLIRRCRHCGGQFKTWVGTNIYCSERCADLGRLTLAPGRRVKVCRMCGGSMTPRKGKLCCSEACQHRLLRRRTAPVRERREVTPYYRCRFRHQVLARAKARADALDDRYIKQQLATTEHVDWSEIPPEILELKRNQLRLFRAVRNHRKGVKIVCTREKLAA